METLKSKLDNPYVRKFVLITFISFLIYSPVYIIDPMLSDFLAYFSLYYNPIIIAIVGIIAFRKAILHKPILILLFIVVAYLPHITHPMFQKIDKYLYYHKSFSTERLQEKYESYNEEELKNLKAEYKAGHIYLKAEYNPIFDKEKHNGLLGKSFYQFTKKNIEFLVHETYSYRNFTKLKYLSLEVKYFNKIIKYNNIPLKDKKVITLDKEGKSDEKYEYIEKLIKDRMEVIELD